ncbi:hypothetical protein Tsubulata_010065 [Turnera subulata]|uniref:Uncharacterized protein n=1 Tax=Turnera subulata TaxID=218843 RepID=A0A9Q0FXR2_9ROSI|nr:hypothetical protein Tsubulata_010065 [Turnera subulata]
MQADIIHRRNILVTLEADSSSSKKAGAAKEESFDHQETDDKQKLDDQSRDQKDSKGKERIMNDHEQKARNPSGAGKESLVAVSWRVPQRKRGEKHPGFNLDYSPPKTHPPSHN